MNHCNASHAQKSNEEHPLPRRLCFYSKCPKSSLDGPQERDTGAIQHIKHQMRRCSYDEWDCHPHEIRDMRIDRQINHCQQEWTMEKGPMSENAVDEERKDLCFLPYRTCFQINIRGETACQTQRHGYHLLYHGQLRRSKVPLRNCCQIDKRGFNACHQMCLSRHLPLFFSNSNLKLGPNWLLGSSSIIR